MTQPSPPEARTREEAVRLAQQTHGEDAPITQIRPVRTGGLLGFFASERYVAEVAEGSTTTTAPEGTHGADLDLSATLNELDSLFSPDPDPGAPAVPYASPAPTSPAPAPSPTRAGSAASPFAAALARMSHDAQVTQAVQSVQSVRPATPQPTQRPPVLSGALVADRNLGSPAVIPDPGTEPPAETGAQHPVVARLTRLGVPAGFLPATFGDDVAAHGLHAALTRALALRLPRCDPFGSPVRTVAVLGIDAEALPVARLVATMLRCDPGTVRWAAPADLLPLVPASRRLKDAQEARDWATRPRRTGVDVVAASRPGGSPGTDWIQDLPGLVKADVVLAVADATRKPVDVTRWLRGLSGVTGLAVQHTNHSGDPATMLGCGGSPVVLVDGQPSTPGRWASLLCERLNEQHA